MNTQFSKYPKLQNLKTEFIPISQISQSPDFEKRKQNEIKLKKQEKFKGKNPIECLEINGYKVLKDEKGNVIVGFDKSYDYFEGTHKPRSEDEIFTLEQMVGVPQDLIKDYNSLWELTCSGWDSNKNIHFDGDYIYPYIFVSDEKTKSFQCWRWDNSDFLRVNCLTHNWSKENYEKYYNSWEFKHMVEQSNKMKKYQRKEKIGRNDKCSCGSGLKYKKCCINK